MWITDWLFDVHMTISSLYITGMHSVEPLWLLLWWRLPLRINCVSCVRAISQQLFNVYAICYSRCSATLFKFFFVISDWSKIISWNNARLNTSTTVITLVHLWNWLSPSVDCEFTRNSIEKNNIRLGTSMSETILMTLHVRSNLFRWNCKHCRM